MICLRGSSPSLPETSGRAGGCCRLCCFCFASRLALRGAPHARCRSTGRPHVPCPRPVLCAPPAAGSALFLSLALLLPPVTSAARAGPGRFPDPFGSFGGSGVVGANATFPSFVAALLRSAVQTPLLAVCALGSILGFPSFVSVRCYRSGDHLAKAIRGRSGNGLGSDTRDGGRWEQGRQPPCPERRHGALPGSVGCWDTPKPWAGLLPCGVGCRQRLLQPLAPARPHLGELGAAPTPATASGSVAAPAALGASLGASPGLCWPRKFQLPVTASGFFFYPPGQISASPHAVPFQPAAAASSPPRQRGQLGVSSAGPWWPRCVFQRRRRCPPAHVTAAGAAGLAPAGLRSWSCVQRGGTGPSPGLPFPRQCSTWLRTAALPLTPSRVEEPSSLQRSSLGIS